VTVKWEKMEDNIRYPRGKAPGKTQVTVNKKKKKKHKKKKKKPTSWDVLLPTSKFPPTCSV